jgi:phosphate:Na+ symporter
LYELLYSVIEKPEKTSYDKLSTTFNEIQNNYTSALNNFYKDAQISALDGIDTTTIINFNRALFSSNKAMLIAVKDLLLNENEAESFNDLIVHE